MEKTYGMMVAASVIEEVKKAVIGKQDCIKKVMAAILAGGHILIEDIPGVGKTTMAVAFSKSMGLLRHRVQFTPDVLPADIVGFSLYDKKTQQFVYKPGAAMCNLLLADEINRDVSEDPVGASGSHGGTAGDGRSEDVRGSGAVYCDCYGESVRLCGNSDAS